MTTLRLQVAVFGCGSSQYPKFCAAAVSAAEHLERLGAEFAVDPSPATHAILTVLKAGESVFQILLLTKTVVHAYRVAQPLFHALFLRQNTV